MLKIVIAFVIGIILFGCVSRGGMDAVPLLWKPTVEPKKYWHPDLTKLQLSVGGFRDMRADKSLIGMNFQDPHDVKKVKTGDDVGKWVSLMTKKTMVDYGISTLDSSNLVMTGDIVEFMVQEGEDYKANVNIEFRITGRSGNELWTGMVNGSSTRFGRSFNIENYYESLSDAVIDAVGRLVEGTDMVKTLVARVNNDGLSNNKKHPKRSTKR